MNKEGEYEVGISAAGTLIWAVANSSPGWVFVDTGYTIASNQWAHIAVSYDGNTVQAYVNGNLVSTVSATGAIVDFYPTLNEFSIGGRQNTASFRFQGLIDDVRVWNVARTGAQIQANYQTPLTGAEAGLAGYWNFAEGFI